jgi:periplasmic protein CpxP/Spy
MKKLIVLFLSLMLVAGFTYAQERDEGDRPSKGGQDRPKMTPEEMAKHQTQRLVKELNLNKEQEAKVLDIHKKYMEKRPVDFSKMRDASEADRKKMFEEMEKVQDQRNKEIRAILTADQAKKFDADLKKREEMRKKGGPGKSGGSDGSGEPPKE